MTDEADRQNTCAALLLFTSSVCSRDERNETEREGGIKEQRNSYPNQGEWLCSEKWNFSLNRTRGYAPSP
jgi:hypothetical protein